RLALGGRVGLGPADPVERVPVGAEADLHAAVALAEDAGALLPLAGRDGHALAPFPARRSPGRSVTVDFQKQTVADLYHRVTPRCSGVFGPDRGRTCDHDPDR